MLFVYLAIGGIAGTLLRYGLGTWMQSWAGGHLPWATFTINMLGSFALGAIVRSSESIVISTELRLMLTVGFCGAFTTFSTYTLETFALIEEGAWGRAALYSFGSLAIGLLAVAAGVVVAGAWLGPARG